MTKEDTLRQVIGLTRGLIRDFPHYFEQTFLAPVRQVTRLPHPLVHDIGILDLVTETPLTAADYSVDRRNGLARFTDPTSYTRLSVNGYYFEWFLDDDLLHAARMVYAEHMHERSSETEISEDEGNVMALGTAAMAYFTLLGEVGMSTDVTDPEGIHIPNSQRFNQIMQLWGHWDRQYRNATASLNVGYQRLSTTEFRVKSRRTNRYIPVFESMEIDDPRRPRRILPDKELPFVPSPDDEDSIVVSTLPGAWYQ